MTQEIARYDLTKSDSVLKLSTELQRFATEQKLVTMIQGKPYPNCEAWQFAGSQLGIIPVMQSIEDLSTPEEIKYKASVDLINVATGMKIGAGFAVCSNKEYSKKKFDEYAIASMAQTRAIAKAFRLSIGWLMKAAGYEATPAEEMEGVFNKDEAQQQPTSGTIKKSGLTENMETHVSNTKPKTKEQETAIFDLLINQSITAEENKIVQKKLPNMTEQGAVECIKWLTGLINQRASVEA